jgi:hypothetical protein
MCVHSHCGGRLRSSARVRSLHQTHIGMCVHSHCGGRFRSSARVRSLHQTHIGMCVHSHCSGRLRSSARVRSLARVRRRALPPARGEGAGRPHIGRLEASATNGSFRFDLTHVAVADLGDADDQIVGGPDCLLEFAAQSRHMGIDGTAAQVEIDPVVPDT